MLAPTFVRAVDRAASGTLVTAASVLALPGDEAAREQPVALEGVVTAAEPDWDGRFFLQDATAGIFVDFHGRQPQIGDVVQVTGRTAPGSFAPVVSKPDWRAIGRAPLPAAKPVSPERLMAGVEDGQRVEIVGLVRTTYISTTRKVALDVSLGGYRVHVFPKLRSDVSPQSLIGATVRVRGTVAASFNAKLRQLTSINLFVPTADDFVVERPERRHPLDQPVLAVGDVARYRAETSLGERIRVKGTVTYVRPGQDLFLQDATGGLHVESTNPRPVAIGETIEAVGFLAFVGFRPVLEDAVFSRTSDVVTPVRAKAVPMAELRDGLHQGELIVLRGTLVGRTTRPVRRDSVAFSGVSTICTVQSPELTFTVECEHLAENTTLAAIPIGSTVETRGIATLETADGGQLRTLTLLAPTPQDISVIAQPSWFTPHRLIVGLVVACALALGVLGWSLTVSKKNAMLGFLVAEREKAQHALQQAHDQLEQRVRERTEQLKVEMTARKAAEVEFKATLSERTRLARELHDTLEQALTGIALQLDTTAKLLPRDPDEATRHLALARGFMKQSQLELRRSIWDLRSRELEQFDLAGALLNTGRQLAAGSTLRVDIETQGKPQPLPEIVEENLLRIGQEALTNVVKHSGATLAMLRLEFTADAVTLEVKDNGGGFVHEHVRASETQQFGLLGMAERAKRLGGRFTVVGAPGEGTTICVTIPFRPPASLASAAGESSSA